MERIERFTEVPMLVLAIVYIPVFIVEYLPDVPPEIRRGSDFLQGAIIAIFAVELLVKVVVADQKLWYLRSRWLEVLIVVLPFLRPLRVLVILPVFMRVVKGMERVLGPYRGIYVLVLGLLTVLTGAGLVLLFESRTSGPITSYWDALWWAVTTITTVGYGDTYPLTPAGRVVGMLLMLVGIALFGVLTAAVAAYFVERTEDEEEKQQQTDKIDPILKRLDEREADQENKMDLILKKLDELERRIEEHGGHSGEK